MLKLDLGYHLCLIVASLWDRTLWVGGSSLMLSPILQLLNWLGRISQQRTTGARGGSNQGAALGSTGRRGANFVPRRPVAPSAAL